MSFFSFRIFSFATIRNSKECDEGASGSPVRAAHTAAFVERATKNRPKAVYRKRTDDARRKIIKLCTRLPHGVDSGTAHGPSSKESRVASL
ncbi:hypothetical protein ACN8ZM_26665 [Burkholderia aenigmatica]|uniref:hypothetical protein n=1 Tax=Burkholderia aenigmatica TaxID=2015348 RepID=UPI003B42D805